MRSALSTPSEWSSSTSGAAPPRFNMYSRNSPYCRIRPRTVGTVAARARKPEA
ncbi:hypothetical protein QF031_002571 [Pseudarthrobacter defluvii]|uniref:hypothetical protein n=1 Tax=Pseudarthrobacter defluvii TaxID=410837 RepID=UPI0027805815|nr:hypothetical protein [Pseudarthrobacter defluvii]MDQ0769822.1 hypothetical protein [Pseudarthrobacter defluvii]